MRYQSRQSGLAALISRNCAIDGVASLTGARGATAGKPPPASANSSQGGCEPSDVLLLLMATRSRQAFQRFAVGAPAFPLAPPHRRYYESAALA